MSVTAIICEYNPLHKGHVMQLEMAKKNGESVVCIMSGGFVQRGQPAIYDKYVRAQSAVISGADLVLELPYPYSCSAAEHFAFGGVSIANSLGVVDRLYFGSESGDITALTEVSQNLSSPEFAEEMARARCDRSNRETPHASLMQDVYKAKYGGNFPVLPNDILGVEYITAISKLNSRIVPETYKREKGYSATRARDMILREKRYDDVTSKCEALYKDAAVFDMSYAERAILAFYRSADAKKLEKLEGMTNGIAERLVSKAMESTTLNELMEKVAGKSFTNAKIRRCILNGIMGVETKELRERPMFTQVLACNETGRRLIRRIEKAGEIAVLTKPAHYKKLDGLARRQAEKNIGADSLLTLMCERAKRADTFVKRTPYVEK